MFALVEHLNGSLGYGTQSHDQLYVNYTRSTNIRFAYFPRFDVEPQLQPTFMQRVNRLFELSPFMEEAILVVGGAQWLKISMLDELARFLRTRKLTSKSFGKVRVIVKDHSAGFHSPIPGLPYIPWTKRKHLADLNDAVVRRAKYYGWSVLQTHRLTWTRMDHFQAYARCSCHFHQIQRLSNSVYTITGHIMHTMLRIFEQTLLSE
ncbi:hypothetical protein PHET_10677 [Paragonimus heterotremus]|uniref:Uncharacterized protein n=1 Tax=Paragonimus heterotremus TaxID=100268 RepID=A0A8J4SU10_9TREM|nr:hypothetical protein PHET_10677 [Paragonimus heterotremus]